jgi:hypothetical protein
MGIEGKSKVLYFVFFFLLIFYFLFFIFFVFSSVSALILEERWCVIESVFLFLFFVMPV